MPNRLRFDQSLAEVVESAQCEGKSFALAFIDLDGFKAVNDTFGHAAGDALLKGVAARLRGPLRASDTLARIAGDEFAVILPTTASPAAAERVAKRLLGALEAPFDLSGASYRASASIGFALYSPPATPDALLAQADRAMYVAKRGGRNGYHLHGCETGGGTAAAGETGPTRPRVSASGASAM